MQQRAREAVGWINERSEDGLERHSVPTFSPGDQPLLRSALHKFTLYTGAEAGSVSTDSR
jgi:hypothetical protein